jgi:hypothetical protein
MVPASLKISSGWIVWMVIRKTESVLSPSPLPGGEGQGEGGRQNRLCSVRGGFLDSRSFIRRSPLILNPAPLGGAKEAGRRGGVADQPQRFGHCQKSRF